MKRVTLVERQLRSIINEHISGKVWHTTSVDSVISILDRNRIACSMSQNKSDALDNKHLFYLSTSRTKQFHSYGGGTARIQLDGNELNNAFKGGPVDYWGGVSTGSGSSPQYKGIFEYEDRIVSYKPFIENATKYITRIDLLLDRDVYWEPKNLALFKTAILKCRELGIPVQAYDNTKDFTAQSNNTVTEKVLQSDTTGFENTKPELEQFGSNTEMIEALASILYMHFAILGEIQYNQTDISIPFDKVDELLNKYGVGELSDNVRHEMEELYRAGEFGRQERFMFRSEKGLRKINSLSKNQDQGAAVMSLVAHILKQHGVTNGRDLLKIYRKPNNNEQTTVDEVWCVEYGYDNTTSQGHLLMGDEPSSRLLSADWAVNCIINAMQDDEWNNEQYGDERKMTHKSDSIEQLERYIYRKLNNPDTTILDAAKTLTILFKGNMEHMAEILGVWMKPYKIDKQTFKKFYFADDNTVDGIRMGMNLRLDIKEKLFGNNHISTTL